jgi:hypothetical protein
MEPGMKKMAIFLLCFVALIGVSIAVYSAFQTKAANEAKQSQELKDLSTMNPYEIKIGLSSHTPR